MDRTNTTLDDIAAVIGFSATLRLSAWYGNGNNLYVPNNVEEGQVLVLLIGRSAAQRLTEEFGGGHLAVPRIVSYEEDCRRQRVATLLTRGFSTREVSRFEKVSERRIQQICRELEQCGIIAPVGPAPKDCCWMPLEAAPEKREPAPAGKKQGSHSPGKSRVCFSRKKDGRRNRVIAADGRQPSVHSRSCAEGLSFVRHGGVHKHVQGRIEDFRPALC